MIGKLSGVLDEYNETSLILDVQGVGYLVFINSKTAHALPPVGQKLTLRIETHLREDSLKLFGFINQSEQEWFRLLQNVQGVGAKSALAILGTLTPSDLAQAISLRDSAALCRAPGIGKKVAERLITELKNKIPQMPIAANRDKSNGGTEADYGGTALHIAVAETVSALTHLGYHRDEASNAAAQAAQQSGTSDTAELIRLSLQILAKK